MYNKTHFSVNIFRGIALICLILANASVLYSQSTATSPNGNSSFLPGQVWADTKGEVINAHGGGVIFDKGKYYWFGEKRGRHASEGVNVYSSSDLYNWTEEGLALTQDADTTSDIAKGCVMERPKVIYNPATKKYVMWFHLELRGKGYS
ncbi:MAG: beta-glucanase, partial [Chitinophagaceae bacterium]